MPSFFVICLKQPTDEMLVLFFRLFCLVNHLFLDGRWPKPPFLVESIEDVNLLTAIDRPCLVGAPFHIDHRVVASQISILGWLL